MGNTQLDNSSSSQKLQYSLETDLTFIKKITDDRYGEVKVMQIKNSKPRELLALKTIMISTIRQCEEVFNQVILRKSMELPTIIRVRAVEKAEMDQYCSHYYKIYVLYEYCEKTLKEEIEKRQENSLTKQYFNEKEIYRLIDCILSALILFSKNQITHSDVRPYTIFLSENTEETVYKLNDIQFMSGLSAYTQFLMGMPDYDNCFLAPELFDQLGHRILQPHYIDIQKSDVFSLGMTALEAATLKKVFHCYDFDEFKVKENVILEYLEEVKLHYSFEFYSLLKNMLSLDLSSRFDYNGVYQALSIRQEQMKEQIKSPLEIHELSENHYQQIEEKPKQSHLPIEKRELIEKNEIKIEKNEIIEKNEKNEIYMNENNEVLDKRLFYDLSNLEVKINEALVKSQNAQQNFLHPDNEKIRSELKKDEYLEFLAKREEVIRKSAQTRESITKERKKKTVGLVDERDLLDSNKLYEMYLEEYEKLKNSQYA